MIKLTLELNVTKRLEVLLRASIQRLKYICISTQYSKVQIGRQNIKNKSYFLGIILTYVDAQYFEDVDNQSQNIAYKKDHNHYHQHFCQCDFLILQFCKLVTFGIGSSYLVNIIGIIDKILVKIGVLNNELKQQFFLGALIQYSYQYRTLYTYA